MAKSLIRDALQFTTDTVFIEPYLVVLHGPPEVIRAISGVRFLPPR
jgi:hypothetical protein